MAVGRWCDAWDMEVGMRPIYISNRIISVMRP